MNPWMMAWGGLNFLLLLLPFALLVWIAWQLGHVADWTREIRDLLLDISRKLDDSAADGGRPGKPEE